MTAGLARETGKFFDSLLGGLEKQTDARIRHVSEVFVQSRGQREGKTVEG